MEKEHTPQVIEQKETSKPFGLVVKVFAFDVGLTTVVGLVVGFVYGVMYAIAEGEEASLESPAIMAISVAIGIGASVYAAYLLRKKSAALQGLVYLICLGLLFGILTSVVEMGLTDVQSLAMLVASLAAYGVGWQFAERKFISLPLVSDRWFTIGSVIGYIVLVLSLLGSFALLFS